MLLHSPCPPPLPSFPRKRESTRRRAVGNGWLPRDVHIGTDPCEAPSPQGAGDGPQWWMTVGLESLGSGHGRQRSRDWEDSRRFRGERASGRALLAGKFRGVRTVRGGGSLREGGGLEGCRCGLFGRPRARAQLL